MIGKGTALLFGSKAFVDTCSPLVTGVNLLIHKGLMAILAEFVTKEKRSTKGVKKGQGPRRFSSMTGKSGVAGDQKDAGQQPDDHRDAEELQAMADVAQFGLQHPGFGVDLLQHAITNVGVELRTEELGVGVRLQVDDVGGEVEVRFFRPFFGFADGAGKGCQQGMGNGGADGTDEQGVDDEKSPLGAAPILHVGGSDPQAQVGDHGGQNGGGAEGDLGFEIGAVDLALHVLIQHVNEPGDIDGGGADQRAGGDGCGGAGVGRWRGGGVGHGMQDAA